jgi:hypothetical protein
MINSDRVIVSAPQKQDNRLLIAIVHNVWT